MVVMLHQWEEAQEGDLWVASGLGRRLRRVTCGCHGGSGG